MKREPVTIEKRKKPIPPKRISKASKFEGIFCANELCENQAVTKSAGAPLCNKHYQRWIAKNDWSIPDKIRAPEGICIVDGCCRTVRSGYATMCETHYYRQRRGSKLGDGPIHPPCKECGAMLSLNQSKYCSDLCRRRHSYAQIRKRMMRWNTSHKMRAKQAGSDFEDVDLLGMFVRANWVCAICNLPIDRDARFPDKKSPSVDHITPIKLGGGHTSKNCQAVHLGCNHEKLHTSDAKLIARAKRRAGETGQVARRKKNGSKLKSRNTLGGEEYQRRKAFKQQMEQER